MPLVAQPPCFHGMNVPTQLASLTKTAGFDRFWSSNHFHFFLLNMTLWHLWLTRKSMTSQRQQTGGRQPRQLSRLAVRPARCTEGSPGKIQREEIMGENWYIYPIGSMVLLYMVTWIPSIYPQSMLAYIPAPWIRHGYTGCAYVGFSWGVYPTLINLGDDGNQSGYD